MNGLNQISFSLRCSLASDETKGLYTDCILILNTLIEKVRVDKSSLFVCFVDFRKAFDSVHHGALWRKLVLIGVSQQVLTILQSMYFKSSSRVRLSQHEATEEFPCQKGVRQGCNSVNCCLAYF